MLLCFSQRFYYAVFNCECNVVNALPTFFQEFGNGTFWACCLQELQLHFSNFQESRFHFLVGNFLNCIALQAQHLFVVREYFFDAWDSDAQMINA